MALKISVAAEMVLNNLTAHNFPIADEQAVELKKRGFTRIAGFDCRITNILGECSFRSLVDLDWFSGDQTKISKPSLSRGCPRQSFDFQLLPTRSKLFAIYYMDLYSYCLQLEEDREKWFRKPYWGMLVNQSSEKFSWFGGNVRLFPLLCITCPENFISRVDELH